MLGIVKGNFPGGPKVIELPIPKVDRCRHLIASKEILPFSVLRCIPFPAVSSASSHRQLVDQDSHGDEFCVCGTGMTDVSLPVFQVEVQKRRIQMIDAKAASIQLMVAASICVQLRAEAHWDQFNSLGPSWDQNPQFCGRIQLV